MAAPVKSRQTIHWRCANCGRTSDSSVKPHENYGGKCAMSKVGKHRWTKSHF